MIARQILNRLNEDELTLLFGILNQNENAIIKFDSIFLIQYYKYSLFKQKIIDSKNKIKEEHWPIWESLLNKIG